MVFCLDYPTPEEVLRMGPPRNISARNSNSVPTANAPPSPLSSAQLELLESKVLEEVTRQIMSGRWVSLMHSM